MVGGPPIFFVVFDRHAFHPRCLTLQNIEMILSPGKWTPSFITRQIRVTDFMVNMIDLSDILYWYLNRMKTPKFFRNFF